MCSQVGICQANKSKAFGLLSRNTPLYAVMSFKLNKKSPNFRSAFLNQINHPFLHHQQFP